MIKLLTLICAFGCPLSLAPKDGTIFIGEWDAGTYTGQVHREFLYYKEQGKGTKNWQLIFADRERHGDNLFCYNAPQRWHPQGKKAVLP